MSWQNYCHLLLPAISYFLLFSALGSNLQKNIYYTAPYDGIRKQIENISLRIDVVNYRTSVESWFVLLILGDVERKYNTILNGQTSIWTFDDSLLGTLKTNSNTSAESITHSLKNVNNRITLLEAKSISNNAKKELYALTQHVNERDEHINELHCTKQRNKLTSLQQRVNALQARNISARLNELEKRVDVYRASLASKAAANELENNLVLLKERVSAYKRKFRLDNLPSNCLMAMNQTTKPVKGIYEIAIHHYHAAVPFSVYCDVKFGGGWTVVQRHMHGRVDFNRLWQQYKRGFGDLNTDFFIGLDKLHALTAMRPSPELLIVLLNKQNRTEIAHYSSFAIGGEQDTYVLTELGEYEGSAGDVLRDCVHSQFSTIDNDHTEMHCARVYKVGWWWHDDCLASNLNATIADTKRKQFGDSGRLVQVAEILLRPAFP